MCYTFINKYLDFFWIRTRCDSRIFKWAGTTTFNIQTLWFVGELSLSSELQHRPHTVHGYIVFISLHWMHTHNATYCIFTKRHKSEIISRWFLQVYLKASLPAFISLYTQYNLYLSCFQLPPHNVLFLHFHPSSVLNNSQIEAPLSTRQWNIIA